MAVIKCKMCGGDLNLVAGQSVAECEYCGSKQTVPSTDNEKKLTLFARANRLRAACEFDKAAGIYEAIIADFPEEAESYWGLVLCKYGIEYVDDPATGKKIPTCHRSSFDSVMDDSNFEQAMENADEVALRVYRQEAKLIESIRKGILEVSSNEKPYDIFICYKETDSNGDRTVDSLLAQDIYDALTSKGYRVFFSRITLEDKLGQAYEPYIFAALNSAKIMLAVGTCYEHYNAVWVKNEWSRYLKIIAQDKSKYLIPCYKGLDAYDMPKEFAHLQGQDMGKVGAIADLLRGIEKLMPRQKSNTVVVQEKVVVGNAGGSNKIASLLDRGNMALEDGDWAKADSFFEDVLNNDSKNAQAYLGKTLAQERCRTVDALVRKRRDVYQNVSSEKLYIQEKSVHIGEMAEKYSLPGYVDSATIRNLYQFDLSYTSEVSGRQKQYREEESWWQNHRWLSRAEKFAAGAVAQTIQNEKKHLFTQLNDRVKKAQEAGARAVAKLEVSYDAHIAEADKQAEKKYNDALACREKDYQTWLNIVKTTEKIEQLKQAEKFFKAQKEYKDSKNLAEHCRKRIEDVTAEQKRKEAERKAAEALEAERRRIAEEKTIAERKKKQRRRRIIAAIVIPLIVIASIYVYVNYIPKASTSAVDDAIVKLSKQELTLTSLEELEEIEKQYADLPEREKKLLSNYEILINIREKYDIMEQQEVERIEKLINTLPVMEEIRLSSEPLIDDVEREFSNTTDAVRGKVGNQKLLSEACEQMEKVKEECWQECTTCGGDGRVTCGLCKGKGSRIVNHTTPNGKTWQVSQECATTASCSQCGGKGGAYIEKKQITKNEIISKSGLNAGETIRFGTYEQDNDLDNGKEGIDWIVLEVKDGKALVISKYGLDCRKYNESRTSVTWENSSLRRWLNNDFINTAFTDEEGKVIVTTTVPEGFNVSDYTTQDKLFLLSYNEVNTYFSIADNRTCEGTIFAKEQGAVTTNGNCYWWLRSRGAAENYAVAVNADAEVPSGGYYVDVAQFAIRPAMWIDVTLFSEMYQQSSTQTSINLGWDDKVTGDIVTYGIYQGENIAWKILEIQDNKALLISTKVLDSKNFHASSVPITWADCDLRNWLNSTFLQNAFTPEEQIPILLTKLPGSVLLENEAIGGDSTEDYVFLLSREDVEKYMPNEKDRWCVTSTEYAQSQNLYYERSTGYCTWWLRTTNDRPYYSNNVTIDYDGDYFHTHSTANNFNNTGFQTGGVGVRPAMWVQFA